MSIKLIALDLDGTIVHAGTNNFTKRTYDTIKKAEKMGIIVCFVTGRPYPYTKQLYEFFGLETCLVTMCGAMIYDDKGKVVHQKNIPSEIAKNIIRYSYEKGIYVMVFAENRFEYIGSKYYADIYQGRTGIKGHLCMDLLDRDEILTPKMILMDEQERRNHIEKEYSIRYPSLSIAQSMAPNIEVTSREATKSSGLKQLEIIYGVKKHEMMAIGDSGIDVDMIKYAGTGVAMADSDDQVKHVADYITYDVKNDGAAHAIEKFCF